MENYNLNKALIKSQKVMAISCMIFAILSNFINLNISIVPAFSLLIAIYNFEKSILTKNIKINLPFFVYYNYCVPFILFIAFFILLYFKKEFPEKTDFSIFLLIFTLVPAFIYFNKIILLTMRFPFKISHLGLDDTNYKIVLDFKNKKFFATNDFITFNSDNIIENTTTDIYELKYNKEKFEKVIGKDISKFNYNDINLAKMYNY